MYSQQQAKKRINQKTIFKKSKILFVKFNLLM